jgi:hypothetical protein
VDEPRIEGCRHSGGAARKIPWLTTLLAKALAAEKRNDAPVVTLVCFTTLTSLAQTAQGGSLLKSRGTADRKRARTAHLRPGCLLTESSRISNNIRDISWATCMNMAWYTSLQCRTPADCVDFETPVYLAHYESRTRYSRLLPKTRWVSIRGAEAMEWIYRYVYRTGTGMVPVLPSSKSLICTHQVVILANPRPLKESVTHSCTAMLQ